MSLGQLFHAAGRLFNVLLNSAIARFCSAGSIMFWTSSAEYGRIGRSGGTMSSGGIMLAMEFDQDLLLVVC